MSWNADDVARRFDLRPHPEGGLYRETFRDRPAEGGRGALTAIYYLLRQGELSAWHRVHDAVEVWHHYAGAPLELVVSEDGRELRT
ncbi:MAG: cupin domain-containing protein, partial [Anaerolineales bacterium]